MDDVNSKISDERLIDATLSGDDGAFAHLIARYKHRVFALASRFARDHDELEDICQEAFIKTYDKLGAYRREAPFEHWLSKITVRACYDALRSRRHEKHSQPLEGMLTDIKDEAEMSRSQARQARELLKWAMEFLSVDERMVITLMELEELSLRETAEMTGWSEANVKVRAYRARQALKKILEKNDVRHA